MNGKQMTKIEAPLRKRGRPRGKGRAPLSLEDRRARNAEYERQRRAENADAMTELAAAIGRSPHEMTNADLLAKVITFLRKATIIGPADDVDSLKRANRKLMEQIEDIEHRIVTKPELSGLTVPGSADEDVPVRTHSNNAGRKKLRLNGSLSPEVPCSRTSAHTYALRYAQQKRKQREAIELQPLPAAQTLQEASPRVTSMTDIMSTGSDIVTSHLSHTQVGSSYLGLGAIEVGVTLSESNPVLDYDFLLEYLPGGNFKLR